MELDEISASEDNNDHTHHSHGPTNAAASSIVVVSTTHPVPQHNLQRQEVLKFRLPPRGIWYFRKRCVSTSQTGAEGNRDRCSPSARLVAWDNIQSKLGKKFFGFFPNEDDFLRALNLQNTPHPNTNHNNATTAALDEVVDFCNHGYEYIENGADVKAFADIDFVLTSDVLVLATQQQQQQIEPLLRRVASEIIMPAYLSLLFETVQAVFQGRSSRLCVADSSRMLLLAPPPPPQNQSESQPNDAADDDNNNNNDTAADNNNNNKNSSSSFRASYHVTLTDVIFREVTMQDQGMFALFIVKRDPLLRRIEQRLRENPSLSQSIDPQRLARNVADIFAKDAYFVDKTVYSAGRCMRPIGHSKAAAKNSLSMPLRFCPLLSSDPAAFDNFATDHLITYISPAARLSPATIWVDSPASARIAKQYGIQAKLCLFNSSLPAASSSSSSSSRKRRLLHNPPNGENPATDEEDAGGDEEDAGGGGGEGGELNRHHNGSKRRRTQNHQNDEEEAEGSTAAAGCDNDNNNNNNRTQQQRRQRNTEVGSSFIPGLQTLFKTLGDHTTRVVRCKGKTTDGRFLVFECNNNNAPRLCILNKSLKEIHMRNHCMIHLSKDFNIQNLLRVQYTCLSASCRCRPRSKYIAFFEILDNVCYRIRLPKDPQKSVYLLEDTYIPEDASLHQLNENILCTAPSSFATASSAPSVVGSSIEDNEAEIDALFALQEEETSASLDTMMLDSDYFYDTNDGELEFLDYDEDGNFRPPPPDSDPDDEGRITASLSEYEIDCCIREIMLTQGFSTSSKLFFLVLAIAKRHIPDQACAVDMLNEWALRHASFSTANRDIDQIYSALRPSSRSFPVQTLFKIRTRYPALRFNPVAFEILKKKKPNNAGGGGGGGGRSAAAPNSSSISNTEFLQEAGGVLMPVNTDTGLMMNPNDDEEMIELTDEEKKAYKYLRSLDYEKSSWPTAVRVFKQLIPDFCDLVALYFSKLFGATRDEIQGLWDNEVEWRNPVFKTRCTEIVQQQAHMLTSELSLIRETLPRLLKFSVRSFSVDNTDILTVCLDKYPHTELYLNLNSGKIANMENLPVSINPSDFTSEKHFADMAVADLLKRHGKIDDLLRYEQYSKDDGCYRLYCPESGAWVVITEDHAVSVIMKLMYTHIFSPLSSLQEMKEFLALKTKSCISVIPSTLQVFHLQSCYTQKRCNALRVLKTLKDMLVKDWVDTPDYICFKNGLVNLRTGDFLGPAPPGYGIRYLIAHPYAKDADDTDPELRAILASFFPAQAYDDSNLVNEFIQVWFGYCLTGEIKMEKSLWLTGRGSNGKSIFNNLLKAALQPDVMDCLSMQALTIEYGQNNDVLYYAKHVRLATVVEMNDSCKINAQLFKNITGGDQIPLQAKYKSAISKTLQMKLVFFNNDLPVFSNSLSLRRRIWNLPMRMQFVDDNDSLIIAKLEREGNKRFIAKKDVDLEKRVIEQYMPAFLRWLVQGAVKFYTIGKVIPPPTVVQSTKNEAMEKFEIFEDFVNSYIIPVPPSLQSQNSSSSNKHEDSLSSQEICEVFCLSQGFQLGDMDNRTENTLYNHLKNIFTSENSKNFKNVSFKRLCNYPSRGKLAKTNGYKGITWKPSEIAPLINDMRKYNENDHREPIKLADEN